ncbi:MAG TPA: hypothetical protein VKG25_29265 [Bryobacteraceae bacterium]|nr:hypothetical protein [Bryobacteraceae bacterium]
MPRSWPVLAWLFLTSVLCAQDNYEIQVYEAPTVAPGNTMVELHSNFTFSGSKSIIGGMIPTEHAWHETLEITQGITPWFETGFYVFTSINPGYGWQWVGDHIRPRVRAPEDWHLPVGLSMSFEFGYQRAPYSPDTWTLEIRPIIDKEIPTARKCGDEPCKVYISFNPTFDRSFHGPSVPQGVVFSPNFKFGYDLTKRLNAGLEYYGSLGPVTGFDAIRDQQQQIVPAIDLNLGPDWEFNFGVGVGVTRSTDHLLVKMILGRRFDWGRSKAAAATP